MRTKTKILGIETSCDETAAAIVEDGSRIISNIVASQIDIHARYGGVVPEVASRQHLLTIIPVVSQAMTEVSWQDINGIAVTFGPGLAGRCWLALTWPRQLPWLENYLLSGLTILRHISMLIGWTFLLHLVKREE